MKPMKIQKILKRLLQLHPKSIDLSLKRIKRLLKDLNNPEKKIENLTKDITSLENIFLMMSFMNY